MINEYAQDIRRKLHMHPETGLYLPKTLELVRDELSKIGVDYTEEYGKGCIVAVVNPEKTNYTIGIRADMDAVPITEENDVPYKSCEDGKMHACGHDAHTAIALSVLKELNEIKDQISCRVKFFFQSGEEGYAGAKYMVEDGAADDVDCIVALHVDALCPVGTIKLCAGPQNANSDAFVLEFFGKTAHVARQEEGVDANMAAIRAYTAIEFMLAKEVSYQDVALFNAGEIHGGTAHNNISDYCRLNCTLRTWESKTENRLIENIQKISGLTAKMCGAEAKFTLKTHYPVLVNDDVISERLKNSATKIIGTENIHDKIRGTGGEDFAFFANLKPACMFRLGVRNKKEGIVFNSHNPKFDVDENALDIGIRIFKQFVFDNMNNKSDAHKHG
ncbi:MAG: amidohydrolase [Clostridia bacterium]|nr:amidohydrolase [Clostridia bacterium]